MMSNDRRRRLVSRDEARLWREVMKGATAFEGRLPEEEDAPPPAPDLAPLPVPPQNPPPREPAPPGGAARQSHRLDHGKTVGIDRRTAERLKKGGMAIEARLDLHGLIQDEAYSALRRFILASFERERRCLLVITGKGTREGSGVLRGQVPRWLNEASLRPFILAFSYAQPRDGGEGALYVLLKRRR
ncbi:endonuclease MutS2 [mine drainage metagenome]|uniref:Endonuclease MutS2 n=1 Tax=mine drainage metagenome TaxID=410659 RepID=A0A1J5RXT4_9ZZZZ